MSDLFRPNAEQFDALAGCFQDYLEALDALRDIRRECLSRRDYHGPASDRALVYWVVHTIRCARRAGWFDPEH
jgi:hypothetical protein